jgi:hypothetical protein
MPLKHGMLVKLVPPTTNKAIAKVYERQSKMYGVGIITDIEELQYPTTPNDEIEIYWSKMQKKEWFRRKELEEIK